MECKCENLSSVFDKGSVDPKVLAMQINQIQISHLQLQKKESGINHEISITTKRKGEVLLSDGSLRLKLDKWRCINFLRNLLKWINTRDQLSWDLWNEAPSFFNAYTKENICTTHWGNIAGSMHQESFSSVKTSRYFTDGPPHCSKSLITKPFVTWHVRTNQVWGNEGVIGVVVRGEARGKGKNIEVLWLTDQHSEYTAICLWKEERRYLQIQIGHKDKKGRTL